MQTEVREELEGLEERKRKQSEHLNATLVL